MGEARDRLIRQGNERTIHLHRREAVDLVNLLTTPTMGANGQPIARGTKNRDERDRLFSALHQFGSGTDILIDAWEAARDAEMDEAKARAAANMIPLVSFPTITVDAINYMRNTVFTDMTIPQTLALGRLEQRLIMAMDGKYELPPELLAAFERAMASSS